MNHRDLFHYRSADMRQHGHEPVKSIKRKYFLENRSFKCAQVAASILKIDSQNCSPRPARDFGRKAPEGRILSFGSHSANEIALRQQQQHSWQIHRIILEIAVESTDEVTTRRQ